jgi:hypothetical protein
LRFVPVRRAYLQCRIGEVSMDAGFPQSNRAARGANLGHGMTSKALSEKLTTGRQNELEMGRFEG